MVIAALDAILNRLLNGISVLGMLICFLETAFNLAIYAICIIVVVELCKLALHGFKRLSRRD